MDHEATPGVAPQNEHDRALSERLAALELQVGSQQHELFALQQAVERLHHAVATATKQAVPAIAPIALGYIAPVQPRVMASAPLTPTQTPTQTPTPTPTPAQMQMPTGTAESEARENLPPLAAGEFANLAARSQMPLRSAPSRGVSLESRVGSQWFARVGVLALLLGAGLFFKLAYDNGWIHPSPLGKTLTGLIAGAAVVLWSERFRRKGYAAFSYSLKAVGTGVLYLTLWAAFHLYGLLPAPVALTLMIAVTAWNATMAVLQEAELLAAYALIGGFLTPGLLGTGGNHEAFLFTYLAALDFGVLWLLIRRPWQRLLLGCFPATVGYFIAWYVSWFYVMPRPALETGLFVVLLAAPFVAIGLVANQREGVAEGVMAPLAASAFLSLGLYSVLEDSGQHLWLPWMCVVLAALYVVLARVRRNGLAPAVHTSIAIVLLTVAIPLKASGRWLTVSWLIEGVALMWAATRGDDQTESHTAAVLRWLGFGALSLGLMATLLHSFDGASAVVFNTRLATELCGVAAAAAGAWLWTRIKPRDGVPLELALILVANLLLLWAGVREIETYFRDASSPDNTFALALTISAWFMVFAAGLLAVGFWRRSAAVRWQGLGLLVFTIAKVFLYDVRDLSAGYRVMSFLGLGALLMAVSFAYQRDLLKLHAADGDSA
jgi:uncharacterized membrane protein